MSPVLEDWMVLDGRMQRSRMHVGLSQGRQPVRLSVGKQAEARISLDLSGGPTVKETGWGRWNGGSGLSPKARAHRPRICLMSMSVPHGKVNTVLR